MAKGRTVPRPIKRAEYVIVFGTHQAEKGWMDLKSSQLNAVVDAWDFLTRTPLERLPKNHQLRGDLATVTHDGTVRDRWQHELSNGARLWFYVEGQTVVLFECHTRHPNATK